MHLNGNSLCKCQLKACSVYKQIEVFKLRECMSYLFEPTFVKNVSKVSATFCHCLLRLHDLYDV